MARDRAVPSTTGAGAGIRALRPVEIVRLGWGVALLTRPRDVVTRVHHVPVDPVTLTVARVLGARHVAQAVLTVHRPSPELVALGVCSDAAHALSMAGLAVVSAPRRRAGVTDAAIALAFAAAGAAGLRVRSAGDRPASRRGAGSARRILERVPGGTALLSRVAVR